MIAIDIRGLGRLFGHPRGVGEALVRSAASRGLRAQIAVASSRAAAMVLALARPGLTVIEPRGQAAALAAIPLSVLLRVAPHPSPDISTFQSWGIKTLGELAALPPAKLAARLGQPGLVWQSLARGEDGRPLVPALPEERFESSIELDWPIEGLEPLSFVLTRLLEPLSTKLERRDRGAAAIHVMLELTPEGESLRSSPRTSEAVPARGGGAPREKRKDIFARSVQLPSPIRDVRTLRTLILLDLESHPPSSGIERVSVVIDPTPGRVWQHTLFSRARPAPEQVSTLVARLNALMGSDRIGRPALVDSYRPGAFEMPPFGGEAEKDEGRSPQKQLVSALRRCRQPVPARVAVVDGRPAFVTTDRRGFVGGRVLAAAGPWCTSGDWWERLRAPAPVKARWQAPWDRDEWDVALGDGAVYRIFQNRGTGSWFIDAIVD